MVLSISLSVTITSPVLALNIGEAVQVAADRLQLEQKPQGNWLLEEDYIGSIVAGMVSAYQVICDSGHKSSAELGGDYIINFGRAYEDQVYALTRLSEIADDPLDNSWRTAVSNFYYNVKYGPCGTEGYISGRLDPLEPSTAVFYLANAVVAAYYVDAEDKHIFRNSLIRFLADVDDSTSWYPVLGLGIATWALAQTGDMNGTLVDLNGTGRPYWNSVTLADLPDLLLGHQVPDGNLYEGSFYWRFDHTNGNNPDEQAAGYTEDTIFGVLGLAAACKTNPELNCGSAFPSARDVLLVGVHEDGTVYEHIWLDGYIYYFYAGEMLQALGELMIPGDLNLDGCVDFSDFARFARNWCAYGCTRCSWCDGADINHSGEVNNYDLEMVAQYWLQGINQ
ncbi:MAG: hypothetical protein JSV32_05945 [Dehalococcoidia bacterium]|nr:MAG: hypothetical protein JSV32_05945 [Dehalococcoidia bacterium]